MAKFYIEVKQEVVRSYCIEADTREEAEDFISSNRDSLTPFEEAEEELTVTSKHEVTEEELKTREWQYANFVKAE